MDKIAFGAAVIVSSCIVIGMAFVASKVQSYYTCIKHDYNKWRRIVLIFHDVSLVLSIC